MDNLTNRRFIQGEHKQDSFTSLTDVELQNGQFRDVVFPLDKEQRYFLFRTMVWNYGL